MVRSTKANKPFEKVFLYVVGPLDTSRNGNRLTLTMQDDFTKFSVTISLPNHTTNTIATAFIEHLVCLHGVAKSIVIDQGPNFLSKVLTSCYKML